MTILLVLLIKCSRIFVDKIQVPNPWGRRWGPVPKTAFQVQNQIHHSIFLNLRSSFIVNLTQSTTYRSCPVSSVFKGRELHCGAILRVQPWKIRTRRGNTLNTLGTGWSKETVDCNFLLTDPKLSKSAITQWFLESLNREVLVFWYFKMLSVWNFAFRRFSNIKELLHYTRPEHSDAPQRSPNL